MHGVKARNKPATKNPAIINHTLPVFSNCAVWLFEVVAVFSKFTFDMPRLGFRVKLFLIGA